MCQENPSNISIKTITSPGNSSYICSNPITNPQETHQISPGDTSNISRKPITYLNKTHKFLKETYEISQGNLTYISINKYDICQGDQWYM